MLYGFLCLLRIIGYNSYLLINYTHRLKCIEIIGMRVNEDYIDISKVGSSKNTLFDTGNSAIVLCEPVHNAVFKILQKNGCFKNEQSELLCWCEDQDIENYPNISFYSRGVKTDVTPEFYLINPSIDPVLHIIILSYLIRKVTKKFVQ